MRDGSPHPGDTNYDEAAVTVTATVNAKSAQNVTITGKEAAKVFGDADFTISAAVTAEGGAATGNITFTSSNANVATIGTDGKIHIAGVGGTTITATAAATDDCEKGTDSFQLTVNPKDIGGVTVDPIGNQTYTGAPIIPATITVKDGSASLASDDYDVTFANNTNAGTATVTITGKRNYTGKKDVNFTIGKAAPLAPKAGDLAVANKMVHSYTYGLGALLPDVPSGQSWGASPVTYTLGTVNLGSYYDSNHAASIENQTLTLPIQAVESENVDNIGTIAIVIHTDNFQDMTATIRVRSVNKKMPTGGPALSAASLIYGQPLSAITLSGSLKDGETDVPGIFSWANPDNKPAVGTGTYAAAWVFTPHDSEAYAIVNGTTDITVNKAPVTVTAGSLSITMGSPVPTYSYSINPEGVELGFTPTVSCSYTTSSPAGAYPITVTGPDVSDDGNYSITYTPGTLTVNGSATEKVATPTASPNGGTFTGSTSVTLACATEDATIYYTTDGTVPTTSSTQYTGPITLRATTTVKAIAIKDGMTDSDVMSKTFTRQSSSGGNSGGGSGTPGTPNTPSTPSTPPVTTDKTTENGTSTTETTAKPTATTKDGTATTTVSSTIGSEIVKQAEQNKSENVVIAPEIKGDVTKTEVSIPASTVGQIGSKTAANLTVSTPVANVTIPHEALGDLSKGGESVHIAAERTGNTVELSVKAGSKTVESIPGGVTVTVPVEETKPGTVAVLVREDGTRQVIRKSVAGEDGVTIPLDGSAKVEIVDNSKQFVDVSPTNWAANAVAFASSHELFNGTSSTTFSPELSMSRSMLAVVLHNLENNPSQVFNGTFTDVGDSMWYTEGVTWAAEKGIIAGYGSGKFGPDDDITREQLAVMLWRYAGSPTVANGSLNFADADTTSSWALDAMRWATKNGIINGKGNGILDPTGKATRAQTAQMLKNFMDM